MTRTTTALQLDWTEFNPWRIQPLQHGLSGHPLLEYSALKELARRHEAAGRVRSHSNTAKADTPFNTAPDLHPNQKGAVSTLHDITDASAWMSLLYVHTDPIYKSLVDDVLDGVKGHVELHDPGMCYRGGWIFVSSPHTVTPFHFDNEHGFLVQILGRKRVYVWEPDDTIVAPEMARDLFLAKHSRDLLVWKEEFRERAQVFDLEPGMGCYMPSTSPHLVEVGDEASVTASFTYYTSSTRRRARIHRARHRLQSGGIQLASIGSKPWVDSSLYVAWKAIEDAKHVLKRLAGRMVTPDDAPYAYPKFS